MKSNLKSNHYHNPKYPFKPSFYFYIKWSFFKSQNNNNNSNDNNNIFMKRNNIRPDLILIKEAILSKSN